MDNLEMEAKRLALQDAQEGIRAAFGRRLDSRRPKPKPKAAEPPPADGVDLEAVAAMLGGG